jgi:hypothetical protein
MVNNWAMHRLAAQPNLHLSGPFISNGKPEYGAMIGIGAGACAFSTFTQETSILGMHTPRSDLMATFANLGSAGLSTWETLKFLSLADQARAARTQPGTLAPASIQR